MKKEIPHAKPVVLGMSVRSADTTRVDVSEATPVRAPSASTLLPASADVAIVLFVAATAAMTAAMMSCGRTRACMADGSCTRSAIERDLLSDCSFITCPAALSWSAPLAAAILADREAAADGGNGVSVLPLDDRGVVVPRADGDDAAGHIPRIVFPGTANGMYATVYGTCSPGHYAVGPSVDNGWHSSCAFNREYPEPLSASMRKPESSCLVENACGAWLESMTPPAETSGIVHVAMQAAREEIARVERMATYADRDARVSTTRMGAFIDKCERTSIAGSTHMLSAIREGYAYLLHISGWTNDELKTRLKDRPGDAALRRLTALGILSMHNAPALVRVAPALDRAGFKLIVVQSYIPDRAEANAALRIVGSSDTERSLAVRTIDAMSAAETAANDGQQSVCGTDDGSTLSDPNLRALVAAAAGVPLNVPEALSTEEVLEAATKTARVQSKTALGALRWMVSCATLEEAEAVITAIAAVGAARALGGGTEVMKDIKRAHKTPLEQDVNLRPTGGLNVGKHIQTPPYRGNGLGRVPGGIRTSAETPISEGSADGMPSEDDWIVASDGYARVVAATEHPTAKTQTARSLCTDVAAVYYTDQHEADVYTAAIPSELQASLPILVDEMRELVARAVEEVPAIRNIFVDPSMVASTVRSAQTRIAGAPPHSPLGRGRTMPRGFADASDGAIKEVLKQAAAVSADRVQLALVNGPAVDHSHLFNAYDTNAYYITPLGSVMISLGLLVPPIADAAYNYASLRRSFGFIVAHEFSHASMHASTVWADPYGELLAAYKPTSVWPEALADVMAASALSLVEPDQDYTHAALVQAQLWCALVPIGYRPSGWLSHPRPDARIPLACATLATHGIAKCDWDAACIPTN